MHAIVLAFALLLCLVQGEVYVDLNSGCGSSCNGTQNSAYLSINQGLSYFSTGGTIVVNDGVYKGFGNKNLNVSSSYTTIVSVNGPSKTIIDCEGDGYAIDLFSGTFVISGFTIRNCYRHYQNPNRSFPAEGAYGGGALSIHSTYTRIYNVVLENNNATGLGGAIYIYSNSVEIYNTTITNNQVSGVGGGVFIASANLIISNDTVITGNKASQNGSDIFCISGSVELRDNESSVGSVTCAACSITNAQNKNICPTGAGVRTRVSSIIVALLFVLVVLM